MFKHYRAHRPESNVHCFWQEDKIGLDLVSVWFYLLLEYQTHKKEWAFFSSFFPVFLFAWQWYRDVSLNYNLSVVGVSSFCFVLFIFVCYWTVHPSWLTMGKSQCMKDDTVLRNISFWWPKNGYRNTAMGRKWLAFTQQCKGISRQLLAAVLFDQTELWHFRFGNKTGNVLLVMNNTFFSCSLVIIRSRDNVVRNTHGPVIKISKYYWTDKKNVVFSIPKRSWDMKPTDSFWKYLTDGRLS